MLDNHAINVYFLLKKTKILQFVKDTSNDKHINERQTLPPPKALSFSSAANNFRTLAIQNYNISSLTRPVPPA